MGNAKWGTGNVDGGMEEEGVVGDVGQLAILSAGDRRCCGARENATRKLRRNTQQSFTNGGVLVIVSRGP